MANEEKAVDRAQRLLIEQILGGTYPPGTELPGERPLSKQLGVARPALREAMQRMSHDGWMEISQGRASRVSDYLRDGNLNVLIDLLSFDEGQPMNFVPDLLQMWSLLAYDYTFHAVEAEANRLVELLMLFGNLDDRPESATQAMWQLHRALIDHCGNMVYGLIFNSFADFYHRLAFVYYQREEKRADARQFWADLCAAARQKDSRRAAKLMQTYLMHDSEYWRGELHEDFLLAPPAEEDETL